MEEILFLMVTTKATKSGFILLNYKCSWAEGFTILVLAFLVQFFSPLFFKKIIRPNKLSQLNKTEKLFFYIAQLCTCEYLNNRRPTISICRISWLLSAYLQVQWIKRFSPVTSLFLMEINNLE